LWMSKMDLITYVFEKLVATHGKDINQGSLRSLMRTSRGTQIERLRVTDPGGGVWPRIRTDSDV
jgi:hypothetical protein